MVSLIILCEVEFVVCDPVRNVGTTGFARGLAGINIIISKNHLVNGDRYSCLPNTASTTTPCRAGMNSAT